MTDLAIGNTPISNLRGIENLHNLKKLDLTQTNTWKLAQVFNFKSKPVTENNVTIKWNWKNIVIEIS